MELELFICDVCIQNELNCLGNGLRTRERDKKLAVVKIDDILFGWEIEALSDFFPSTYFSLL